MSETAEPESVRDYIPRFVDSVLDELLLQLPAISLDGPRGVGKTVTASRRADTVYHLDMPETAEVLRGDPRLLESDQGTILLDEWQNVPGVWDRVRRYVDQGAPAGRFILTGSHPGRENPRHTGAGRIVRVRMRPLSLAERLPASAKVFLSELLAGRREVSGSTSLTLRDYVEEIVASGLPDVRRYTGRARRSALDGYIDQALERDVPELGIASRRPLALRGWLRAYAAATASTASYQTVMNAATPGQSDKPSRVTVTGYRDTLAAMWLIDPVDPWLSLGEELGLLARTPKHYLADPALAARLLDLNEEQLLQGAQVRTLGPQEGSILGRLFESLVAMSLHTYAQALEARLSHYRDRQGRHEVDFLVEGPDGGLIALEVKLAGTVGAEDVKHLLWLKDKLGSRLTDMVVLTTGQTAYRREDGIAVVPFVCLGVSPSSPPLQ